MPDVGSVYGDTAAVYIVKTHQKVDQGSFSAAGRTHNGDSFSGMHADIQVFNQRPVRYIGESNMSQRNFSLSMGKNNGIVVVRGLFSGIQQFKDTRRRCHRILKFRQHAGNIIKRLAVLFDVAQEAG